MRRICATRHKDVVRWCKTLGCLAVVRRCGVVCEHVVLRDPGGNHVKPVDHLRSDARTFAATKSQAEQTTTAEATTTAPLRMIMQ